MDAFSKRFFAWIALIFLGFTAISFKIKNLIIFPVFASLVVVFYLVLSKRKSKNKNLKLLCLLLIGASALGILCSNLLVIKNEVMIKKHSGEREVSGYVLEVSASRGFMCEYVVRVEELDGKRVNFDMVLISDYQSDLSRGDFFKLNGSISSLEEREDIAYLKNNNHYDYPLLCLMDEDAEVELYEGGFGLPLMLTDLNSKLSSTLKAILGKDAGSLASALLLGNRELLSDDTLRDFKRAGVYHMLALSGLHVAILIGILEWLLKKLLVPRNLRICALTLLSLFYVALTGFALSACRSMLMLWLMYLSLTVGKRRDTMTSLFFAVSLIVFIRPSAILDIGLQLSFLSTLGVIGASIIYEKLKLPPPRSEASPIKKATLSLLKRIALLNLASLCVFVFTLPVIMIYFGEVSLATFLSNIFMGVICEIFMIFSLLSLLLSWSVPLRFPFAEISARVGILMQEIVSLISDIEGVMLSLSYPLIELLVWGLFIGFLTLFAFRLKKRWLIFVPCVLFALLMPINVALYNGQRADLVRAEYVKADSMVLSSFDQVYICDMSDGSYGGFFDGVKIAKENCFTEIDGIILTHYHSTHITSLERLIKSFKIHSVLLPLPQSGNEDLIMRSIVRILDDEGVPAYIYENEKDIEILGGELSVSPRAYVAGYSHPSVAISFAYGNDRITLLGMPYFDTYLERSGVFDKYVESSDYLIFGSDGRPPKEEYSIFEDIKDGCEISFSSFDLMNKSDFEDHINDYEIYFNVNYKKYDLK